VLATATPVPIGFAANLSYSQIVLFSAAEFGDSALSLSFLLGYMGVLVVVTALFAVLVVCLRAYRYETVYPKVSLGRRSGCSGC
jgi:hypothetical protein